MHRHAGALLGLALAGLCQPAAAETPLPLRIGSTAGLAGSSTEAFRAEALRSDAVSVESSRLALERSRDPAVRAYAERTIEVREATTKALLPEGTSLSSRGNVVSDRQGIRTDLSNPVGLVLAPVTIAANIGTGILGGVLGGLGVVDVSPAEPGRRVALGDRGRARLDDLHSRRGRSFDRAYVDGQAESDARTLGLYVTYARNGDSAAGRRFAEEATPYIAARHGRSARLAHRRHAR